MRILMVLDCEVNQPEVLPSFIESSALVLGLKYCQDGGEPILERMAVNHYRAAGPTHGPSGGVADSLDEATAAFRAAWERPLSSKKADEKCSL